MDALKLDLLLFSYCWLDKRTQMTTFSSVSWLFCGVYVYAMVTRGLVMFSLKEMVFREERFIVHDTTDIKYKLTCWNDIVKASPNKTVINMFNIYIQSSR